MSSISSPSGTDLQKHPEYLYVGRLVRVLIYGYTILSINHLDMNHSPNKLAKHILQVCAEAFILPEESPQLKLWIETKEVLVSFLSKHFGWMLD